MNSYEKSGLEKMLIAYDYLAAHPGCSVYAMSEDLGMLHTTMRAVILRLRSGGWAVSKTGARSQAGQLPAEWSLTQLPRPSAPPPGKKRGKKPKLDLIKQPAKIEGAKRIITRARQIGIARDWAVAAIFGDKAVA